MVYLSNSIIFVGGIIQQFSPLYNSESPTQVLCPTANPIWINLLQAAFIMIGFLMKVLKDTDPAQWGDYVLAYDNMYNQLLCVLKYNND